MPHTLDPGLQQVLAGNYMAIRSEPIAGLEGNASRLERVVFDTGQTLARAAMFPRPPVKQQGDLAAQLGRALPDDGRVQVDRTGATTITGIYAAGDLARTPELELPAGKVITAAAAAAQTAITIDRDLALADVTAGPPHHQPNRCSQSAHRSDQRMMIKDFERRTVNTAADLPWPRFRAPRGQIRTTTSGGVDRG